MADCFIPAGRNMNRYCRHCDYSKSFAVAFIKLVVCQNLIGILQELACFSYTNALVISEKVHNSLMVSKYCTRVSRLMTFACGAEQQHCWRCYCHDVDLHGFDAGQKS